jgi:hypothetical protein
MANWASSTPKEDKEKDTSSTLNSNMGHKLNGIFVTTRIPTCRKGNYEGGGTTSRDENSARGGYFSN